MEQIKVTGLVVANLATATLHPLVEQVGSLLVMAGQIAVASVTVWYIVKKARAIKVKKDSENGK